MCTVHGLREESENRGGHTSGRKSAISMCDSDVVRPVLLGDVFAHGLKSNLLTLLDGGTYIEKYSSRDTH